MKTAADIVNELRVAIDMSDPQAAQILYEKWLKQDAWPARLVALPLVVGCDPDNWHHYLETNTLGAQEEILWHICANDLTILENDKIVISRVAEWARAQSIDLHPSFLRIFEFLRKVLVAVPASDDSESPEVQAMVAGERETVLGAALSLLAKMPNKCRDDHGFVDGAAIVKLIEQTAARWFPHGEPNMSASEMARLIDKWLE